MMPSGGVLMMPSAQVCGNSAKVQLNSGILMRRQQRWDEALHHFHRARQIEAGYCEPSYWIGITLAAQGQAFAAAIKVATSCRKAPLYQLSTLSSYVRERNRDFLVRACCARAHKVFMELRRGRGKGWMKYQSASGWPLHYVRFTGFK
jgi:hypothetical protein